MYYVSKTLETQQNMASSIQSLIKLLKRKMHVIEISTDCWLVSAHIQRNLPPSTWTAGKSIVNVPTDDSLWGNRLPASVLSTALN